MKRLLTWFGRKTILGLPTWFIILVAFTFAFAAILWMMINPITGSQVQFDVLVVEVDTNDNGGGVSVPDSGLDPMEAGDTLKHPWDVAFCDGTPNGSSINFVWDSIYSSEPLFCQIRVELQNNGTDDVSVEGIAVTGAPVTIAAAPPCGSPTLLNSGGTGILVFSLGVDTTALESGGWVDGSIDIAFAVDSTLSCP